jgi:hypothetical protein
LPISVSVTPATQAVDQGLKFSVQATLTNDVSGQGVRWSTAGPGTISPLTGLSTVYYSPTAAISNSEKVVVTATSVADPTKTAAVQITVNPYPTLQFQSLFTGTVGIPYNQPVVMNGGTAPFQWSVDNGTIGTGLGIGGAAPDGLTLNAATGVISGTPTGAGTWYFETTVTDADGVALYIPISVQINPASTVAGNAVPLLNQPLTPASVAPGSGALMLKVSGTGFVSGATVDWNGAALATAFVDSGHLSAVVPAANVASAKTAAVTVVNPAPGGGASNAVYFPVAASASSVSFVSAANSPLQIYDPSGLAVADFNEDGKTDLAVAGGTRLYALMGNGDGTFTPGLGSPLGIPSPPYDDFASPYIGALAVGDFTHSGHAGLAVAEYFNEAAVILQGYGNGTFETSSAAFAAAEGEPIGAVAAADFNADGNLDLALIASISGTSSVALGYGKGAFNSGYDFYAPGTGVAVGDFNGDGKLDIAVPGLAVWLGNGDGTFTAASGPALPNGSGGIVAGDFNGDGKLDLAVADYNGNVVDILLGKGDGTFEAAVSVVVGGEPDAMVVGDFNRDGKLDLAVANYGGGSVTLLLGNGDGTFAQASGSPYAVGNGPYVIAAGDFNGDGKLDLAVGNLTDGTVSILLQQ